MVTIGRSQLKLLETATDHIARVGVGGLRIDWVAHHAGVNKRMIYHHFGNRDGLAEAVFADQSRLLASRGVLGQQAALLAQWVDLTHAPLYSDAPIDQAARVVLRGILDRTPSESAASLCIALVKLIYGVSESSLTELGGKQKPRVKLRPRVLGGDQPS